MKIPLSEGRMKASFCPYCETILDSWLIPEDDEEPSKGDFTICLTCENVLRFGESLKVEIPHPNEIAEHCDLMELGERLDVMRRAKESE